MINMEISIQMDSKIMITQKNVKLVSYFKPLLKRGDSFAEIQEDDG